MKLFVLTVLAALCVVGTASGKNGAKANNCYFGDPVYGAGITVSVNCGSGKAPSPSYIQHTCNTADATNVYTVLAETNIVWVGGSGRNQTFPTFSVTYPSLVSGTSCEDWLIYNRQAIASSFYTVP